MTEKKGKSRGLGRGLSALMADVDGPVETRESTAPRRADVVLPVEKIFPNPQQPRRSFTENQLEELAESIRSRGIIQPLIVRPRPGKEDEYEIVAGERRWRAAQIAQKHDVPVLIRDFDDTEVLEVAIIENIQRADLNPVEEALGYRQLMERFGHTQGRLSEALGKSRSHIANLLRLLQLPEDVQQMLREGQLTAGHARALITSDDASALARKVVSKGLSVRETERLSKASAKDVDNIFAKPGSVARRAEKDADTRALEGDLSAALRMGVSVNHEPGGEAGQVIIRYNTLDQLDELCALLSARA